MALLILFVMFIAAVIVVGQFVIGPLWRWAKRRQIRAGVRTNAQIDQATAIADGIARAKAEEEYRRRYDH